jgi:hypothetical protein
MRQVALQSGVICLRVAPPRRSRLPPTRLTASFAGSHAAAGCRAPGRSSGGEQQISPELW